MNKQKTNTRRYFMYALTSLSFLGLVSCATNLTETSGFDKPKSITWSDQGWSAAERERWHHINAGQAFAPLAWLKALHVPGTVQSFIDSDYLRGLGFLDKPTSITNPEGLPVGFSLSKPQPNQRVQVGLSCAACHTGQINKNGYALRIDGSAAGADIVRYFTDYNVALFETYNDPEKWQQFARLVLEQEAIPAQDLRREVEDTLTHTKWDSKAQNMAPGQAVEAGHGRMDPFNRIGNQLFGMGLLEPANYHAWNAPVGTPYLWGVPRLNWVHYNASFNQPMARNILQVLGNGGRTSFIESDGTEIQGPQKWNSNFDVEALVEMEYGYQKLKSPAWPSKLLGPYNPDLARQGRVLFSTHCAACHAPRPIKDASSTFQKLAVTTVPLQIIGTDPAAAQTFRDRRYRATRLGSDLPEVIDGASGLEYVTNQLAEAAYDKLGYSSEQRTKANGSAAPNRVRALAAYKARPLEGVWASPPYLHNGSVPTVYELLSPPSERSSTFWLGTYEYDPVHLGFVNRVQKNGFMFDTRLPGNSNAGHAFSNDKSLPGVIGPMLTHQERLALIEFLKAWTDMPPDELAAVPPDWEGFKQLREGDVRH